MNKTIVIISLIIILLVIGCAKEPVVEPEVKDTAITQTSDAIDNADKTLEDLEDVETDAELDDIESVLEQI